VAEPLEPATDRFVIRAPDWTGRIPDAVAALGTVEKLGTTEPLYLLKLTARQPARDAWAAVEQALGGKRAAYPALLDGGGSLHYPTGEVTVRFEQTPSLDDLKAFGAEHHLELRRGNEFSHQQFVYAPRDPAAEFLPDLIARLAVQPGVRSAWANTLSAYRRRAD
jgi:hypothetical protein